MGGLQTIRTRLFEAIEAHRQEALELNDFMADHPEVSGKEYLACEQIAALLEKHGMAVERQFAGIPTAFRAAAQKGGADAPRIGILAEYDALPEIGHACGHCASGALSVLAALAVHDMDDSFDCSVDIIGTPDEEATGKKIDMAEQGLFDDYDFVVMIHMDTKNQTYSEFLALSAFYYRFRGKPAHAAASPWEGRNALNGATLMIHAFDMMRQQLKPATRIHGIIRHGGDAGNVIPDDVLADYTARYPDSDYLKKVVEVMHDCARGAALATRTQVEIEAYAPPLASMKQNPAGTALLREIYEELGLPVFTGKNENIGSSDIGNVSHRCAAFHPTIAVTDEDIPHHTVEFAAKMKEKGIEGVIAKGAQVIALMIARCVFDPALLQAIRRDFKEK